MKTQANSELQQQQLLKKKSIMNQQNSNVFKEYYINILSLQLKQGGRNYKFSFLYIILCQVFEVLIYSPFSDSLGNSNNENTSELNPFKYRSELSIRFISSEMDFFKILSFFILFSLNTLYIAHLIWSFLCFYFKSNQDNENQFKLANYSVISQFSLCYNYIVLIPSIVVSLEQINDFSSAHYSFLGILQLITTVLISGLISIHDCEFFLNEEDKLGRLEVGFHIFECFMRGFLCVLKQYSKNVYGMSVSLIYSISKVFFNANITITHLIACITFFAINVLTMLNNYTSFEMSQNLFLLFAVLPLSLRIGYSYHQNTILTTVQTILQDPKLIFANSPRKIIFALKLIHSHRNNFYEDYITRSGVLLENLFTSHILNCQASQNQCFCHKYQQKAKMEVSDLLGDEYRKQFLNEFIVHTFEGYLENLRLKKNVSSSDELYQIQRSYIQFLVIEQLYPPKTLSLLFSALQELHQKNKTYQQFFFHLLQWRVTRTLNSTLFWKKSQSVNSQLSQKPLPILLPIEFDEQFTSFKNKLSNQLLRQKEYIDYLCQGYLHLQELEIKSKRNLLFIKELIDLQKKLILKNPANEEFQFYSNIFNAQLNFYSIEANTLQRNQLVKRREAIILTGQSIDVFQENSCSVYVSLADKEYQILKVSNNFTRVFEIQVKFIIGKALNILMPKQMSKIHSDYVSLYTQKNCISSFHHTKLRQVFGLNGNGFIIPLNISIKIENKINSIGLCALVTRNFSFTSYNIITSETGKIISLSETLFDRVFRGYYTLNDLQELNIENILEGLIEDGYSEDQNYDMHGLLKIKGKNNRKDSMNTQRQLTELTLFTKYKCTQIPTDLYDKEQYMNNFEFENFWEKIQNNQISTSNQVLKRNSFHKSPAHSIRESFRKNSHPLSEYSTSAALRQVISPLSATTSTSISSPNGQRSNNKIKTIIQHLKERKGSLPPCSSSRLSLAPCYSSNRDATACVFEEEEDEFQDKLSSRQISQENLKQLFSEREDYSPDVKQKQQFTFTSKEASISPFVTQADTFGCLSPLASKDLQNAINEYDLFSNRVPKAREGSLLIPCPSPTTIRTVQQIQLEGRQNSIQDSKQISNQESRRFSVVYQSQPNCFENNKSYDKKNSNSNSSIDGNKEIGIESLSSKKTEKVENKKRLLMKQITNFKLSTLPKIIAFVSFLSMIILISSSLYFYLSDHSTITASESIFDKISKSFQLALDIFIYSKEKSFTKIIKFYQNTLKIDSSTLNQLTNSSITLQSSVVQDFIGNVENLTKSRGEEYFNYMVNTKIKVLSAIVTVKEIDFYRQDSVMYNLINYISSLNQLILQPNVDNQFAMSVIYANMIVFEQSLMQIQSYILSQSENYFNQILSNQLVQIVIISVGSFIIFILGFPFSLYLQKKKADLLQLLGSYSPKRLEDYIGTLQQSLEKIRQFEYDNYIQQNPHLFNNNKTNKNASENQNTQANVMFRISLNAARMDQNIVMNSQFQKKERKRRTRQMASFNNFSLSTGYHILIGFLTLGFLIIQPIVSYVVVQKFVQDGKHILNLQQVISRSIQFISKQEMLNVKIEDMITRTTKSNIFYYTYGLTVMDEFSTISAQLQELINENQSYQLNVVSYNNIIRSLTHGNICDSIGQNPQMMNGTYTQSQCENLSQGVYQRGLLLAMTTFIQYYQELWSDYNSSEAQINSFFSQLESTDQNIIQRNKSSKFLLDIFNQIQLYLNESKDQLSEWMITTLTYLFIFQVTLTLAVVAFGSIYLQNQFKYGLRSTQALLTNIPISLTLENDYIIRFFK